MLVVNALHQLPRRAESPGELGEHLVLFVCPWKGGIGTGLAVVVAQVLIAGKEPQPISHDWSTEIRRAVAVPFAFVPADRPARRLNRKAHRLAGHGRGLPVVRRIEEK